MTSFKDDELGEIIVRRSARATAIRIKIGTDGRYVASVPAYTPLFFVKQTVRGSRAQLRQLAEHTNKPIDYRHGQQVGKSHSIAVVPTGMVTNPQIKTERQRIVVLLPNSATINDQAVQQQIRDTVAKVLRREAKAYLPRRLSTLATTNGFHYERVRFSHSGGRWGGCSSAGTISLNIALMKLPFELIDYVIIHELCHTKQMNHSANFWSLVESCIPDYKARRKVLKAEHPSL
jgi:predicted metal-dependent hydrolase